jgi:Sec-independent protein translocase protein TatA
MTDSSFFFILVVMTYALSRHSYHYTLFDIVLLIPSYSILSYLIRDVASDTHKNSKKEMKDMEEKEEDRENVEKEEKEGEEIGHPTSRLCCFDQAVNTSIDQTTSRHQHQHQHQHQKHHSSQSSVFPSPLETDYMMVTAYDEAVQNIFGNITACEVAVSLTKNSELRKIQMVERQRRRKNFDGTKKKEKEKEEEEVREAGYMNTDTTPVNSSATNCQQTSIVAADENSKDTCENNETTRLLSLLPSFNFSKSCAITADSLIKSSVKKDQFIFLLRLNQFVDENGFRISGGRSALSLEGILPPY